MRMTWAMVGILTAAMAAPVMAQQAATAGLNSSEKADLSGYLCKFAGQCGPGAASSATIPAPRTKGFQFAAPQGLVASGRTPQVERSRVAGMTRTMRLPHGGRTARPAYVAAQPVGSVGTGTSAPRANLLLTFGYNSAQLTPSAAARARVFARALSTDALRDKRFLIEGHTDSRGSRDFNLDLSRRRAQSVAEFLAGQGVDRSRVEVKGVGPDEPLPGHSAAAQANRRVEAVLL